MPRWGLALCFACLVAAAAGSSCEQPLPNVGGGTSTGSGSSSSSGLTSDESDTASRGGEAIVSIQEAMVLANSLFPFSGIIFPNETPAQNAQAILARATHVLQGCGSVSLVNDTVFINFGAPPGCAISGGTLVAGSAIVTVTLSASETTIKLTFTSLEVAGRPLVGTITFVTTTGSSFDATVNLTIASGTLGGSLTAIGLTNSFTLYGALAAGAPDATTFMTLDNIFYVNGDCYPTSGLVTLTKGQLNETIAFGDLGEATARLGTVTVSAGTVSTPSTLPTYGTCPAPGG
jgi:hypothetical protein